MDDFYEREFWDTANRLELFVTSEKSTAEFTAALDQILEPLPIGSGTVHFGAIELSYGPASRQPPTFPSVPSRQYNYMLVLEGPSPFGFWGALELQLSVALASALRTKWSCHYLVLLDGRGVLFYSGTNEPCLVNERWPGHEAYSPFLSGRGVTLIDVPLAPEAAA